VSRPQAHEGARDYAGEEKYDRDGDHHAERRRRQAHTIARIRIGGRPVMAAARVIRRRDAGSRVQSIEEILRDAALAQLFVQRIQHVHIRQQIHFVIAITVLTPVRRRLIGADDEFTTVHRTFTSAAYGRR